MKKLLSIIILLSSGIALLSQNYQRYEDELPEKFIKRIIAEDTGEFIHPVIEANWNGKKVIIAFWHENELADKNTNVTYTIGKMYVPVDDTGSYKEIHIDRISENPLEAQIFSVFFDDADGDGKRELIVLCGWEYRHYQMSGITYAALVYDDINYDTPPHELSIIDYIHGGTDGNNDMGETMTAEFASAAGVREHLDRKGRKPNDSFFRRSYEGKIGKNMSVAFYLERNNSHLGGFYFYEKKGFDIRIYGTIENDIAILNETDDNGNIRAIITGEFSDSGFTGTWKDAKTGKTYPVELKKLDYTIPHQPYIEGEYVPVMGCDLYITIRKEKQRYVYTLKINDHEESGVIYLMRYREYGSNVMYIDFADVKWAENRGDLSEIGEDDEMPQSTDTYGLEGYWSNGSISFQNYGNAMNYYVKLADCEGKFIEIKRKD